MLHATVTIPQPTASRPTTNRLDAPILGGEAWVVPFEPGGPAWITASAPQIRVVDQRRRRGATAV